MPKFWENWIFLFSMLPTDSKFENIVYSKMDITYNFRKMNSKVFQNVLMPRFALNGFTCIVKEPRWQHSLSLSAHTHTNYKYKLHLPLNVRATVAPLTFEYRATHFPIVSLYVHTGQIGTDTHAHERYIQTLCTLYWGQTLRRKCTKLYACNVPRSKAAMYQTVRRQSTKTVRRQFAEGGLVAPWQNTLEKVESPNLPTGAP